MSFDIPSMWTDCGQASFSEDTKPVATPATHDKTDDVVRRAISNLTTEESAMEDRVRLDPENLSTAFRIIEFFTKRHA